MHHAVQQGQHAGWLWRWLWCLPVAPLLGVALSLMAILPCATSIPYTHPLTGTGLGTRAGNCGALGPCAPCLEGAAVGPADHGAASS